MGICLIVGGSKCLPGWFWALMQWKLKFKWVRERFIKKEKYVVCISQILSSYFFYSWAQPPIWKEWNGRFFHAGHQKKLDSISAESYLLSGVLNHKLAKFRRCVRRVSFGSKNFGPRKLLPREKRIRKSQTINGEQKQEEKTSEKESEKNVWGNIDIPPPQPILVIGPY